MLYVSTELMLITVVLGGWVGWLYRGNRTFLRRNWSHVLGSALAYSVFFYGWLLYINRQPMILREDWIWVVVQLVLIVGAIGSLIGFGLHRYLFGKNRRK